MADSGRLDEAMPIFDEAIRLALAAEGPLSRIAINARLSAASRMTLTRRATQAKAYYDAAIEVMRAIGGKDDVRAHVEIVRFKNWMFEIDGTVSAAEVSKAAQDALHSFRSQPWPVPKNIVSEVVQAGAWADFIYGDVRKANESFSELATDCLSFDYRDPRRIRCLSLAAEVASVAGSVDRGIKLSEEALRSARDDLKWAPPALLDRVVNLAAVLMFGDHQAEATARMAEVERMPEGAALLADRRSPRWHHIIRWLLWHDAGQWDAILEETASLPTDRDPHVSGH